MASEPQIVVLGTTELARPASAARLCGTISDYWALTKPEVNFLILVTTFAAFYLASKPGPGGFRALMRMQTLLGPLLVASGSGALSQFNERRLDGQMRRTPPPPLASG